MIRLTQPPSRASDVRRIKAAMEANGCTYHRYCDKYFDVEWINVSVSADMAARWVIRWMRDQWWTETNV